MKEKRLIWQLYPSYVLVIVVTLTLVLVYATNAFETFYLHQTTVNLKAQTSLIETQILPYIDDQDFDLLAVFLSKQSKLSNSRLTIIDKQGTILADSDESPENMDNHLGRPEIIQALSHTWGSSVRYSDTLQTRMMYIAKAISSHGQIIGLIRSSLPINDLDVALWALKKKIILWGILISIFSALLGFFVSKKIRSPLQALTEGAEQFSEGNFDFRLDIPKTKEFRTLAEALNTMAFQLNDRMTTIMKQSKEKEALESVRKEFVANVSHELKTPVTLIKGFLETLLNGAGDNKKDRDEFLSIIQIHTHRVETIIEDLLSLSRLEQEADYLAIEFETACLNNVIEKAITSCYELSVSKEIEVVFQFSAHFDATINVSLMEQAFINLIDNAIKYSPNKSVVSISLTQLDHNLVISISDQGCGISEQHIPHLFERFYRVDRARSRDVGGTGLGLSIVKHIMQVHNGFVAIESVVGTGSVFTLTLLSKK